VSVTVFQRTENYVGCFAFCQNVLYNILLARLEHYVHVVYACAIGGSYCDVSEDLIFPGYDAVSLDRNITNVKIKYS
jgi:hypothetical protein